LTSQGLAEDVALEPLRVEAGHVVVPDRPGLGIDVEERRLRERKQQFGPRKVA
jgi:L-alanine-DL-glutamate epimerase-like enolase superfamily enzyme